MAKRNVTACNVVGRGNVLAHLKKISAITVRQANVEDEHLSQKNSTEDFTGSEELDNKQPERYQEECENIQNESQILNNELVDLNEQNIPEPSNTPGDSEDIGEYSEDGINISKEEDSSSINFTSFDPVLLNSVNCQEFVPRQLRNDVNTIEYQERSTAFKAEYYEPSFTTSLLRVPSQGEGDYFILDLVKNTVRNLTESPGDYDYIIGDFTDNLLEIRNKSTMQEFVAILIEQAIAEPNFLYSAVRLCHTYDEKRTLETGKDISFRGCLYPRLQKEFNSINGLLKEPSDSEGLQRAVGLSLLFADLLCNMKKGDALNVVFLKAVFGIIDNLLEDRREATINCLIKLLKLTGPTLDQHKIKENISGVDDIFNRIRDLSLDRNWLDHLESGQLLRTRLFGVYKLHLRHWDAYINEEKPTLAPVPPVLQESPSSSPDSKANKTDSTIDWNEYYTGDDDEPNEIDDAYEQFLEESGQL